MHQAVQELVTAVERVLGPRPRLVLPPGTRVTQEEESVDGLLVVLRGEVSLGVASSSGEEIRLHHASTGPLIGLPAMAERRKALVTARATTEVELIHLTLEQLDQALAGDPRVGAVMTAVSLRSLARRLRRAEILQLEEIRLNAILDSERAKLSAALAALSEARLELIAQARSATIGEMAAGVAHELNSPLAALTRSLEHAEVDVRALLAEMPHAEVIEQVMAAAYTRPTLSAREERARRRELEQAGVPAHRIRSLVAAGIANASEARRIQEAGLDDGVVDAAAGLGSSLRNSGLAQEHISALVQGLRSAMRPDALDPVPTHVADTIEDSLRLTAHRLDGIEVVRRYDEVEPILAHPGQLTQVWTNLITNAADALAGRGTITVTVSRRGRGVRVEVADTGPGIPESVQERIFEPRFTTKAGAVRFGLGLGLGIARRIVSDHGGTIAVRSAPGDTLFTIDLPAQPPEAGEDR
ncbi:MAG: cyclic nucleotide-binding domain-containing protein [Intrasporangiaceae bacterium]|nr:cyclic nucleotide-binding domain-containing protein [Intrasporangiaceae bacterium]